VEYALQNLVQPIGVSTCRVTRELPEPVREELPSVEDLQDVFKRYIRRSRSCARSSLVRSSAMPIFGQRGLIAQDQLCNSLLHNWNSADR
jgi:hypothetical protein